MKESEMIFGTRAVIEAIQAGKDIDRILIRRDLQNELGHELFSIVRTTDIPVQRVPKEKLDRLTRKNHQGVIAFIAAVTYHKIENLVPTFFEEGKTPIVVLLDGVTDVRNFGAIARSCECAGVDAIVIPDHDSASVTADAIKTSAGALLSIPVCKVHSLTETVRYLRNCGYLAVAATEKASKLFTAPDYKLPVALILGSEDTGISPEILRIVDEMVKIPVLGKIASLNVSAATAVMIYEVIKQRSLND